MVGFMHAGSVVVPYIWIPGIQYPISIYPYPTVRTLSNVDSKSGRQAGRHQGRHGMQAAHRQARQAQAGGRQAVDILPPSCCPQVRRLGARSSSTNQSAKSGRGRGDAGTRGRADRRFLCSAAKLLLATAPGDDIQQKYLVPGTCIRRHITEVIVSLLDLPGNDTSTASMSREHRCLPMLRGMSTATCG
jgi:hypothetical protein